MRRNIWDYIRIYSPALCRLLARRCRGRGAMPQPMSIAEIAEEAGLPVDVVEKLSVSTTWDNVPLPTAVKYLKACGMDWASGKDMHRARVFISQGSLRTLTFLRRSPLWETEIKKTLTALSRRA